jgi:hypothetical protein
LGYLFGGNARKKAELDNLGSLGPNISEPCDCLFELKQLVVARCPGNTNVDEIDLLQVATMFCSLFSKGVQRAGPVRESKMGKWVDC